MYQCPRCGSYTFSLRSVALSSAAVCSNCNAIVRQRRGYRNALPLLPFVPVILYRWRFDVGLAEGLAALAAATLLGLLIANSLIKLEVVR